MNRVDVRMIDFAHVHRISNSGKDEGYNVGLFYLQQFLEKLQKQLQPSEPM